MNSTDPTASPTPPASDAGTAAATATDATAAASPEATPEASPEATRAAAAAPPRKGLTRSRRAQIIAASVLVVLAAAGVVFSMLNKPEPVALPEGDGAARTLSANAHYLDEVDPSAPTVVEFLDFECEACAAIFPHTEEVREAYKGHINYVVRYFPLGGHFNSTNAALAVEAAAQQGKFEEMYRKMFETQHEWGEQQVSAADTFRGFAEGMSLDMASYDLAITDPATLTRVQEDYNAGLALGITGTPTFFLDGTEITLQTTSDLPNALNEALAKR